MQPRPVRRRRYLAGVAGALSVAGCLGRSAQQPVSLHAAGSLNHALENGLRDRVDVPLRIEARGSTELARLVDEGVRDPDVLSLADPVLFESPLSPEWYATFATNALVVAHDDTAAGRRIAEAGSGAWFRPLLSDDVSLGRTDPDLDPLGYRTLFALELATDYYGLDRNLREAVTGRDQIYPETQLLGQFETGGVDAAVTYRSMAVSRGYDYVDLPAAIDLSDPDRTGEYATASYELPDGSVVRGAPIRYVSTVRHRSRAADEAFRAHVTAPLDEFGFAVPDDYPRYAGNAPDALA
ncbi:extracellular solute-binding protein [Halomicrobium urmianum]|uniref:extracellular solute-binding protein n=1 Tax=Halomicrobium urmianum TaxID=1586233 RepID=UPI001CD94E04|nr:extracellular solute-binding protein [Halomicrobium urmianum]